MESNVPQSLDELIAACLAMSGRHAEIPASAAGVESAPPRTMPSREGDPYALLNAGRRQAAVAIWEKILEANPMDLGVWHEIAVAHYWAAMGLEARGQDGSAQWAPAIGYWVGVLASDDY